MTPTLERTSTRTPKGRGVVFTVRPGTNDLNVTIALNHLGDEYGMRARTLSGWFIDVGAHIGAVAVSAALDNPDLRVLAVEAVPDNCDLLEENVRLNGVESQVTVVRAAAARPGALTASCHWGYRHHESGSDGYVSDHRFIGNTWVDLGEPEFGGELEAVSLDTLLSRYAIDDVELLKIDCEGCEWAFLDTPAIAHVALITGEYHGGYTGHPNYVAEPAQRIEAILSPTHDVTITKQDPCVGLFEATRR